MGLGLHGKAQLYVPIEFYVTLENVSKMGTER